MEIKSKIMWTKEKNFFQSIKLPIQKEKKKEKEKKQATDDIHTHMASNYCS